MASNAAENMDYTRDIVLRISPHRNAFIVEEHKSGGIIAYKEIDPVDLYYAINGSYLSREFFKSGFLPENCLHISMNSMEKSLTLWNSELRTDMSYQGVDYINFPIPRLVFNVRILDTGKVAECSIGVVADEKPRRESVMYHYPFSNVYADGKVCTGNNVLPRYKKQEALKHFPRYLMGLPDSDDLYQVSYNKKKLGHKDLMEHLKDKDPAYYYSDILVPNGKTLDDFITGR